MVWKESVLEALASFKRGSSQPKSTTREPGGVAIAEQIREVTVNNNEGARNEPRLVVSCHGRRQP